MVNAYSQRGTWLSFQKRLMYAAVDASFRMLGREGVR